MKTTYKILALFVFILTSGHTSWAMFEGEEDKKKHEKAEIKLSDTLLILDVDAMVEDTLVYEDYDAQIPKTPETPESPKTRIKFHNDGSGDLIQIIVGSTPSDRDELEVQKSNSISDLELVLEAYPNPIRPNGQLNVRVNGQIPDTIEFWSITGRMLIGASGKEILELTNVIPGSYFVKVIQNGQVVCKKILVTE